MRRWNNGEAAALARAVTLMEATAMAARVAIASEPDRFKKGELGFEAHTCEENAREIRKIMREGGLAAPGDPGTAVDDMWLRFTTSLRSARVLR
jgi:hypothetical protein